MPRSLPALLLPAAAFAFAPLSGAFAEPPLASAPAEWSFSLSGGASHAFSTDLDATTDVAVTTADFKVSGVAKLNKRTLLTLSFGVESARYDFDGPTDPMRNGQTARFTALLVHDLGSWRLVGFASGSSAGEDGELFGRDTLSGIAGGGVSFTAAQGLDITLGATVDRTEVDDDATNLLPYVAVEWAFAEGWVFAIEGPEVGVQHACTESTTASASISFGGREIRLDSDGFAPDGALRDSNTALTVGVSHRCSCGATVEVDLGVVLNRRIQLLDAAQNELFDENAHNAAVLGLRASIPL